MNGYLHCNQETFLVFAFCSLYLIGSTKLEQCAVWNLEWTWKWCSLFVSRDAVCERDICRNNSIPYYPQPRCGARPSLYILFPIKKRGREATQYAIHVLTIKIRKNRRKLKNFHDYSHSNRFFLTVSLLVHWFRQRVPCALDHGFNTWCPKVKFLCVTFTNVNLFL